VFLFPHQVIPLHIFEERYRDMVSDLLDGPGRFVIASPQAGERETSEHPPAVVPVGGLGEILRHEKLPDGRYMIWVLGLARVHVTEVESPHKYRQVECLPFMETPVPEGSSENLAQQLRDAASARLKEPLPLPDNTPPGLLADLLLQTLQAPREVVEQAFSEPDVAARARLALRADTEHPAQAEAEADDDPSDGEDGPGGFDLE